MIKTKQGKNIRFKLRAKLVINNKIMTGVFRVIGKGLLKLESEDIGDRLLLFVQALTDLPKA